LRASGTALLDLTEHDLATPGIVFQIGVEPFRVDILTAISGVTFGEAWKNRVSLEVEGVRVLLLGRSDFIANKRATGRLKDLADIEALE